MNSALLGGLGLLAMLALIAIRVPIAFGMASVGFVGMILAVGWREGSDFDFDRGFEFLGHLFVRSLTMQQVSDPEEDAVGNHGRARLDRRRCGRQLLRPSAVRRGARFREVVRR